MASTALSIEFKRQVAQEFLAGETLHGLSKRHDICRNLIRVVRGRAVVGDPHRHQKLPAQRLGHADQEITSICAD
jgi:hypothetical protein